MKALKRILIFSCLAPTMVFAQVDEGMEQTKQANSLENIVSDDGYTVPPQVQMDFEKRYPNSEVTNLFTSEELYTIEFDRNGKHYTTFYDTQNNWVKTNEEIAYDELPQQAKRSFMGTPYSDYSVDEVNIVRRGNEPEYYQLSIQNKGTSRNLYFDSEGTLMDELNDESPRTFR